MTAAVQIQAEEVAAVLRRAIRGEVSVVLAEPATRWAYEGDVAFHIGGWRVTFYNDCDDLDYCDSAVAPDGRSARFEDWYGPGPDSRPDPIDLLTDAERAAVERLLEAAR